MSLKDEDKNTAIKADQMKRFNNITDNCVLRKRKQKTYAEATQSVIVESKIVDISPNLEILMQKVVRDHLTWKQ